MSMSTTIRQITFWLPVDQANRLDAMLGARVAGLGAGAKASRQAYLRELVRRDLEARSAAAGSSGAAEIDALIDQLEATARAREATATTI